MDSRQVEALIEKYWICETSIEEEKTLKAFFEGDNVPENLQQYTPYFRVLKAKAGIQAPEKINTHIAGLQQEGATRVKPSPVVRFLYPAFKVAAVALILLAVGLGIDTRYQNEEVLFKAYSESLTDPEQAMEEVHEAFSKISISLAKAQSLLTETKDSTLINQE